MENAEGKRINNNNGEVRERVRKIRGKSLAVRLFFGTEH